MRRAFIFLGEQCDSVGDACRPDPLQRRVVEIIALAVLEVLAHLVRSVRATDGAQIRVGLVDRGGNVCETGAAAKIGERARSAICRRQPDPRLSWIVPPLQWFENG